MCALSNMNDSGFRGSERTRTSRGVSRDFWSRATRLVVPNCMCWLAQVSTPVCLIGMNNVIDDVMAETRAGAGDLTSKYTFTADEALTAGERWVGPGYSELGKPGAYANNPKFIVRKWQVGFPVSSDTPMTWTPAYSFVSGILPLDVFATHAVASARFQIQSITEGKVLLKLNSLEGLSMQMDSAPVELKENLELNLARGTHQFQFLIDVAKRKSGLRVELEEALGSSARFQLAGAP